MQEAIRDYLTEIERKYKTTQAKEHTYRPALESLIEAIEDGFNAINDGKQIDIGAPDFQVLRRNTPIGFIEAKDIGVDLGKEESKEQIQRYLGGLGNLILTDYLEFRWYVKGEHRATVRIASAEKKRIHPDETQFDQFADMLKGFAQAVVGTVKTARELARRMAGNAHLIRNLIFNDLESDDPSRNLTSQRDAFERTLLPNITNAQFADMYAQTIAYGMFAARINHKSDVTAFSWRGVAGDIPRTNPFLRKLFSNVSMELEDRYLPFVDELADLLARTDMDEVLKDFGKATRREDPIVHFYETFLTEYDPKVREKRGVYYTPEPVVDYIVRSVDDILKERFGRRDGLADTDTMVLDPATGTGTFLYFVIQHIYESAFDGQAGIWNGYVRDHLLKRLFGFELLMAPYAIAHMKLGMMLNALGYKFESDQRLGVYMTNTLEEAKKTSESLFAQFISEEADEAAAIKRDRPIMVVLGNPPYSGHSSNKGDWISGLVRDYYFVDGQPLGERNPKWLQDDYVKFIRFGQWRIEQTGEGVLAFITNHGYLDNPTFRGMRQHLLNTFTDIYIIDLHGNSKKKERTPDGGTDQNVFDIQQGTAIGIFVKERGKSGPAQVHHIDLWGLRDEKYTALLATDMNSTTWNTFNPEAPFYLFSPHNIDLLAEYKAGWQVTDAMPVNSVGIVTGQDRKTIALTLEEANQLALTHGLSADKVETILYRPFDIRHIVYDSSVVTRQRSEVMQHMLKTNLGVITVRQVAEGIFNHMSVATSIIESRMTLSNKGIGYLFPLYLYPTQKEGELFSVDDDGSAWPVSDKGRRPNLNPDFVNQMADNLGLTFITDGKGDLQATFGPEDIFAYAYAIFHSPTYRDRYAEFLKIDFPRLPLTGDVALFRELVARGAELVALHLLRHPALEKTITTYPVSGNNEVIAAHPKYTAENQRVWINKEQYFEGVPPDVWEFHVGGYQVLDKWLKDRRKRTLSYDDIRHYQRIVVALRETIRLMDEIDEVIPAWPLA